MTHSADNPIHSSHESEVTAKLYNLWRRAKLHFDCPVRIPMVHYSFMVILLDEHEWVCVDESQDDAPIMAWRDFQDKGRDALHTPVKCTLESYHFSAEKLRAPFLLYMEEELERRLKKDGGRL